MKFFLLGISLFYLSCQTVKPTLPPDEEQLKAQNKALTQEALTLADKESQRALELFLTINPTKLDREAMANYRKLEKIFSLIKLDRKTLGLSHNNIGAMALDNEDLWLGDWQGGISRYSLATQELNVIREGRASTAVRSINSILIEDRYVWVIASDSIIMYDKKLGSTSYIKSPLITAYPWAVVRYKGTLIVGHQNGGLWNVVGERLLESPFNHPSVKNVNAMLVVGDLLYVATDQGLWLYNGIWQAIKAFNNQAVFSLLFNQNMLWVGTQNNLYRYHVKEGQVLSQNLSFGFIKNLVLSPTGLFASSPEGGIVKIDPTTFTILEENYDTLSPALLRVGALAYLEPYLIVGTLGNAVIRVYAAPHGEERFVGN